jgi:hypothetical protein
MSQKSELRAIYRWERQISAKRRLPILYQMRNAFREIVALQTFAASSGSAIASNSVSDAAQTWRFITVTERGERLSARSPAHASGHHQLFMRQDLFDEAMWRKGGC